MPDESRSAAAGDLRPSVSLRGVGDRWLSGDAVENVRFALGEPVQIVEGPRAGSRGHVALLVALDPEPLYLVRLGSTGARVAQSRLRSLA